MQVDFNNVRRQALISYDKLCNMLNSNITRSGHGDTITVGVEDIQEEMDDLRMQLVIIACCYEPGDSNFKDVSEGIEVSGFNQEDEA